MLILAGACAWIGGLIAATSSSLETHLAARAMQVSWYISAVSSKKRGTDNCGRGQGLGAGTVEALIPLILQDMVFIHQRNKAMAAVVSSQGIIITGLGTVTLRIASNYDWRWIYYITSGAGIIAWILLLIFLPETRWKRSKEELSMLIAHP